MRRKWLILACVILFGCGAALWAVGNALTRPTNASVAMPDPPARAVFIRSTGDIRLAGTYWPSPRPDAPAVLLLHGNGGHRGSMNETAHWLNGQGYAVLAIDFRGHGQSTASDKSFGLFESEDARSAFVWLRAAHPGASIGVIGVSLGGAASLLGPHGPVPADAFVLEGMYPDIRHAIRNRLASRGGDWTAAVIEPLLSYQSIPRYGVWPSSISPIRALAHVRAPVMIVGGAEDRYTPPDETRALYNAVRGPRALHILAGAAHRDIGGEPSGDFKQVLLAFLDRNLKK